VIGLQQPTSKTVSVLNGLKMSSDLVLLFLLIEKNGKLYKNIEAFRKSILIAIELD